MKTASWCSGENFNWNIQTLYMTNCYVETCFETTWGGVRVGWTWGWGWVKLCGNVFCGPAAWVPWATWLLRKPGRVKKQDCRNLREINIRANISRFQQQSSCFSEKHAFRSRIRALSPPAPPWGQQGVWKNKTNNSVGQSFSLFCSVFCESESSRCI